jgi:outer membrane receptor protein involved in Fe transport
LGGTTLREVLERVPGLAASTAYFSDRSIVAARGDQTKINGGHVLFLINGRPTREVLEGGVVSDLLESFPISVLERIEVIKGPGSVLYGSNAFSAVVNLITRKADTNGFSIGGAPGTDGARLLAVVAQLEIERGHFFWSEVGISHRARMAQRGLVDARCAKRLSVEHGFKASSSTASSI